MGDRERWRAASGADCARWNTLSAQRSLVSVSQMAGPEIPRDLWRLQQRLTLRTRRAANPSNLSACCCRESHLFCRKLAHVELAQRLSKQRATCCQRARTVEEWQRGFRRVPRQDKFNACVTLSLARIHGTTMKSPASAHLQRR